MCTRAFVWQKNVHVYAVQTSARMYTMATYRAIIRSLVSLGVRVSVAATKALTLRSDVKDRYSCIISCDAMFSISLAKYATCIR